VVGVKPSRNTLVTAASLTRFTVINVNSVEVAALKSCPDPGVLIVPGYRGSDESHWQSWLQDRLNNAQRLSDVDWESPILSVWAGKIRQQLQESDSPQWIVAHSFGCLAASIAVSDIPWKVAGLVFVAPADPSRFNLLGCRKVDQPAVRSAEEQGVWPVLPRQSLAVSGVLIASENDPWLSLDCARQLAGEWDLGLINIGHAGHINTESGYGAWPFLTELLDKLVRDAAPAKTDSSSTGKLLMRRGRGSVLAKVRQQTRRQMERRI
jgi:uncharacterized protein